VKYFTEPGSCYLPYLELWSHGSDWKSKEVTVMEILIHTLASTTVQDRVWLGHRLLENYGN
jgi:hypothetical protein